MTLKLLIPPSKTWKRLKHKNTEIIKATWDHRGYQVEASMQLVRDGSYTDSCTGEGARLPTGMSYHAIAFETDLGTIVFPGEFFQMEEKAKEYLEEAVSEWLSSRPIDKRQR